MRTPLDVSRSYWAAECRRDLDAVMEHYHDDAAYEEASGARLGHDDIRAGYAEHMRLYPSLEVEIVQEFPRGEWSAIEFDAVVTDPAGVRSRIRGVNVVHVRDGRFLAVRSYEDPPVPAE
jgi:ketosteroid isomerase-like protein